MKQRAIAVIRVSSEEQAAEGRAGMDRQRADVIWAAEHYNLDVVRTVELEGVSGTNVMDDRRFRAVMKDLSDPGIAGVVCSALDRLVRPEGYDFSVLQQFWNTRKLIWTPSGPMDPSSIQGQLLVGIQGLMASQERQMILARTRAGKEVLRRKGKHTSSIHILPRGLTYSKESGWAYSDESWRIKQAYELLFAGESYHSIARHIGGRFNATMVRRTLMNKCWMGVRYYGYERQGEKIRSKNGTIYRAITKRAEPIEVSMGIEPLIAPPIWEEAQRLISERSDRWKRTQATSDCFLCGLLRCSCGKPFYRRVYGAKREDSLYCGSSRSVPPAPCGVSQLRRSMVEQAVEQMFSRYLLRPHVLAKIIAATEAYGGPKDFSQQRQEIERLMAKRGKLIDLHTSERIALKNLMSGRNP